MKKALAVLLSILMLVPTLGMLPSFTLESNAEESIEWTNGAVTATVTAHDVASAGGSPSSVLYYSKDGVNWQESNQLVYTVEEGNPTIGSTTIYVKDDVGNVVSYPIVINNIDVNKPTGNITASTTTATNQDIIITCNASDDQSGVKEYSFDGGVTWSAVNTSVVGVNGSYTCHIRDNAGNIGSCSIVISNIDKTAPIISSIEPSSTEPFNCNGEGDLHIVVNASDNVGGLGLDTNCMLYSLVEDESVFPRHRIPLEFTVNKNGTYNICVIDLAGNYSFAAVTIDNIDNELPVVRSITSSCTSIINQDVLLTVDAYDVTTTGYTKEVGVDISCNELIKVSDSVFKAEANGTYAIKVTDKAKNSISTNFTVSNIDKVKPQVGYTLDTSWTNEDLTCNFSVSDDRGLCKVKLPNGSVQTFSSPTAHNASLEDGARNIPAEPYTDEFEYTFSVNGSYTFEVYDLAGNMESVTVVVSNIDKVAPQVTLNNTDFGFTNSNIVLSFTPFDDNSGFDANYISYDGGLSYSGSTEYTVSANTTVHVCIKDKAGNIETLDVPITNIDKLNPVIDSIGKSTDFPTKDPITLTINAHDLGVAGLSDNAYKFSGESDFNNSNSRVVSNNGTYTFTVLDKAGNMSTQSITVSNIDNLKPSLSVSPSTNLITNQTVLLSVSAVDVDATELSAKSGLGTNPYSYDRGLTWINEPVLEALRNDIYNIWVRDEAGNITTSSIEITNIDKVAPSGSITLNGEDWVNHDIEGTINVSDNVGLLFVKLYEGTEVNDEKLLLSNLFTEADAKTTTSVNHLFTSNGSFLMVAKDYAGNEVANVIELLKIDRVLPQIDSISASTSELTNSGVSLSVRASDSFGEIDYILCPDGNTVNGSTVNYEVGSNGTYTFKVFDKAGNSASGSIEVSNIDTESPAMTITPSTSDWTNQVVLSIVTSDNNGISKIVLPDGTSVNSSAAEYTVTQNGTHRVVVFDNAGNSYAIDVLVSNIDVTAPSFSLGLTRTYWTEGDNTIVVSASDGESGLAEMPYSYNGGATWVSSNRYTISEGGNYSVSVRDKIGNISTLSIDAVMSPIEIVYDSVVEEAEPMVEDIPEEMKDVPVNDVIEVMQPNIDDNTKDDDKNFLAKEMEMFVDWIKNVEVEDAVKTTAVVTSSALLIFLLLWTLSCAVLLKMGRGVKYYAVVEGKKKYLGKCLCRRKKGVFTVKLSRKSCSKYAYLYDISISFGKSFTSVNNGKTVLVKCGKSKVSAIVGDDTTFSF